MHLLELAEKKREHHYAGDDRELGWLKVERTNMEPAARTIDFGAHDFREDKKEDAQNVHRKSAPTDPVVVDQAGDHESEESDGYPLGLFPPEFSRNWIFAHVGRAVDRDDAKNRERQHDDEQQPI